MTRPSVNDYSGRPAFHLRAQRNVLRGTYKTQMNQAMKSYADGLRKDPVKSFNSKNSLPKVSTMAGSFYSSNRRSQFTMGNTAVSGQFATDQIASLGTEGTNGPPESGLLVTFEKGEEH